MPALSLADNIAFLAGSPRSPGLPALARACPAILYTLPKRRFPHALLCFSRVVNTPLPNPLYSPESSTELLCVGHLQTRRRSSEPAPQPRIQRSRQDDSVSRRHQQGLDDTMIAWYILRPISNVYFALHHDSGSATARPSTNDYGPILRAPSSYPLCNVSGHNPGSTSHHVHEVSACVTSACSVLRDSAAPSPVPFSSGTDAPSSSLPTSIYVDKRITYVPPLGDNITIPASHTTIENPRIPATLPDPVAVHVTTQGTRADATVRLMLLSSPELSAPSHSSTSKASTSLSGAITHRRTPSPSDFPDISSSPLVVDNTLPADPSLSSNSAARPGSDHAASSTESHSSVLAPVPPGAPPPRPNSAPDLGAAAQAERSAYVGSRENDAPGPTLAIHKNASRSSFDA
ncbi:hypothetical protein H4582DRAFT_2125890 [Lactarius indigo]|nr:hypothetical protein H4582DRAFT_2125890 [Lactarius indigo]